MRRIRAFDDLSNNGLPLAKIAEAGLKRCDSQEACQRARADDPCFGGRASLRGLRHQSLSFRPRGLPPYCAGSANMTRA